MSEPIAWMASGVSEYGHPWQASPRRKEPQDEREGAPSSPAGIHPVATQHFTRAVAEHRDASRSGEQMTLRPCAEPGCPEPMP
jgi:hypothetical protein